MSHICQGLAVSSPSPHLKFLSGGSSRKGSHGVGVSAQIEGGQEGSELMNALIPCPKLTFVIVTVLPFSEDPGTQRIGLKRY